MRAYFCDRQTFFSRQEAADLVAFMDLPTVDLSCHRGPEGWEPGSWQIPQSSSDLKRIEMDWTHKDGRTGPQHPQRS